MSVFVLHNCRSGRGPGFRPHSRARKGRYSFSRLFSSREAGEPISPPAGVAQASYILRGDPQEIQEVRRPLIAKSSYMDSEKALEALAEQWYQCSRVPAREQAEAIYRRHRHPPAVRRERLEQGEPAGRHPHHPWSGCPDSPGQRPCPPPGYTHRINAIGPELRRMPGVLGVVLIQATGTTCATTTGDTPSTTRKE